MSSVKLRSIKRKDLVSPNIPIQSFSTDNDESIFTMIHDVLSRNSDEQVIIKLEASKTWNCFISLNMTENTETAINAFIKRNIIEIAENSEHIPISRRK